MFFNSFDIKFLLICFLISCSMLAQSVKFTLEGKVIDSQTGEPILLVNVYLAQTTLGSATDANGNFKIPDVPGSLYSLVASAIGYEPQIVSIDLRKSINKFITIKLTPKTYELEEVDIRAREDVNWKKQLELFKKLFFGDNDFAKYCEIKDPYHINFNENNTLFTANTSRPILIRNNALGYEIECILRFFQHNKLKRNTTFSIFPKFREIISADKDSMDFFIENRQKAYIGSTTHLLSLLTEGRFRYRDEGFVLKLDSRTVGRSEEIVKKEVVNDRYYLNFKDCMTVQYWNSGLRTSSKICLKYGSTEFSADGYLMFPGEFEISGAMAKEGVATQLPRFLEIWNYSN